jgi:type I restriction enzyme S subunit
MIGAEELPNGWDLKPLRACVAPKQIWNASRQPRERIRYIELSGIDNQRGVITKFSDLPANEAPSRAKQIVRSGDVIFATTRPNLKNIAIVPRELDDEICSTGFCVLRPLPNVTTSGWLFALCRSDVVVSQVVKHDEKNAYPSVSDNEVLDALVPVPNEIVEQQRLVARIEALTSRIEQARQARQAALAEAEEVFQRALEIEFSDDATENWSEHAADELFEIVSGQVSPLNPEFHDLPYLGPEHVESGTSRIVGERVPVAELKMKSGKYRFTPEHVIYSKIRPALRKVCTPDYHGLCSADMYALRPNVDLITREFLKFLLLAPAFSNYAVEKSDRNAMPKINQTTLRAYRFRVPEPPEQARIVGLLSSLLAKQTELRRLQTETEAELAAFTPALLAKAFRGEL